MAMKSRIRRRISRSRLGADGDPGVERAAAAWLDQRQQKLRP